MDSSPVTTLADETMYRIGAIVAGRRWHELANQRWNGIEGIYGGAYEGDVFALTNRPPDQPEPRIHFVAGGIIEGISRAKAAIEKDVGVFGGNLTQQCLEAGLLDEIVLHVAPVFLGQGVRLFGFGRRIELQRVSLGEAERNTDLHFRTLK